MKKLNLWIKKVILKLFKKTIEEELEKRIASLPKKEIIEKTVIVDPFFDTIKANVEIHPATRFEDVQKTIFNAKKNILEAAEKYIVKYEEAPSPLHYNTRLSFELKVKKL